MSDIDKKFHEFALKSILFKGRTDWYFCYLKSEKIAHVLLILAERSDIKDREVSYKLAMAAAELPHTFAHFAAGEMDASIVIADIFALLSKVRLATTAGFISKENSPVLLNEYEQLAQRFSLSVHPSPFTSIQDFSVPEIESSENSAERPRLLNNGQRPMEQSLDKGQTKGQVKDINKGHTDRMEKILQFVRNNANSSIKDIASAVKGCSEKTVQRELAVLITQGLIKKVGERRWSVYLAI
ncbi:hypothetical protein A2419_00240 [Candidatus Adlerbacteria bacterium RIFOXYC1_FULL_48_26]|uniref:HTH deoR-type domain-containing protein n=1 Tax=Candidatus Adlerbacteria bacterium RIFOXYC1_FULL_48_26 TaxID=1797247 RepID=A0A1F4Y271_9BACT|nr:MAG: hypothetical protein A2419_00240 [Candidatus Adlerbacteria bacterium RIFOXYC1_FULL_48_26]OGC94544.1 MAG: hypothetical protein A2389_01860 [Candidatus Adlerbacteria bacterium RIFOXYB1_FULL_48_10]OGC95963.1 MAG: hypothetical protein A2590_01375 [Candidatus Adlerbacteria bacterium RIFOXYD1_FULL_48_8]